MLDTRVQPGAALPPTPDMAHDPVRATQHIYRVLLDALSNPGITVPLVQHPHLAQEQALSQPWLASVLLTLVDHETSLAVLPFPGHQLLVDAVQRRTRVEMTTVEVADFVVAEVASIPAGLPLHMNHGTLDYPNDGATLLLGTGAGLRSSGQELELSGPGIDGRRTLPLGEIPTELIEARNEAVSDYPLGIDLFLVDAGGTVTGLPRTTAVVIRDGEA